MKYQLNKGVYEFWLDVKPSTGEDVALNFQTRYAGASDPEEFQNRFQMILSRNDIVNLAYKLMEVAGGD